MTRIPALSDREVGPLTRLGYLYARRRFGEVPEPFAVTAHHTRLLWTDAIHETMVERAAKVVPANVRELAVYRVATLIGCSWCVDFGTMLQRLEGLDVDRLKSIDDYATSPLYTDDERAALAYADAMSQTPVAATDEQVSDLERRFGRDGVVELTYLIALEHHRSRMNAALGAVDQGFSSGEACRVPWESEDNAMQDNAIQDKAMQQPLG